MKYKIGAVHTHRCLQGREVSDVTAQISHYPGDGVADVDISATIAYHREHRMIATVTGVRPPGRFGVISLASDRTFDRVESFKEKPRAEQGWINGGFFVFDQRIWTYLNDDESVILEHGPLERLARDGALGMYRHEGFWQSMDTYREWSMLNRMYDEGRRPWLGT